MFQILDNGQQKGSNFAPYVYLAPSDLRHLSRNTFWHNALDAGS